MRTLLIALTIAAFSACVAPSYAETEVPRTADSIVDSIGMNTRFTLHGWYDSENPNGSAAALFNLGIRHIRDTVSDVWDTPNNRPNLPGDPRIWSYLHLNISTILPSHYGYHPTYVSYMTQRFPNIEAFQLGNEVSTDGDSKCPGSNTIFCWPEFTQTLINYYAPQIKAAGKYVQGPSFIPTTVCYHTVGVQAVTLSVQDCPVDGTLDLKVMREQPLPDVAALQYYPNGRTMQNAGFPQFFSNSRYFSTKGTIITETGYGTGQDAYYSGDPKGMTDVHISELATREFLEPLYEGYRAVFSFELLDGSDITAGSYFGNMGWLTVDANNFTETPKLQYQTLRNLISLFNDQGPWFVPQSITYTLSGATPDVHHIMTQRRDGTYLLAIWREAKDPVATEVVNLAVQSPLIVWAQTQTFTPADGGFVNAQFPSNQPSYALTVGPALTVVRLSRYWHPMPTPMPPVGPFLWSPLSERQIDTERVAAQRIFAAKANGN